MMLVRGIARDQLTHDTLNCSMRAMADEGPSLVFCNLPARLSECEFEPSRMSYYNGNEHLSVPFKWEAAPGTPIVDRSSQAVVDGHQESGRLQLRPPPSASNSPLNPFVPASFKDQQKSGLPSKSRSYSRPEISYSMSSRSSASTTTADSSFAHQRSRSKSCLSKRSDFDWPEVSDDEYSSARASDDQEPPASSTASSSSTTTMRKQWSLESTSFSSTSMSPQMPSPVSSGGGGGPRAAGGSTSDLLALGNLVNFATATAVAPPNFGGSSESNEGSDDGDSESSETDDHVRPSGFLSCMPIFSRVRMIQSTFGASGRQTQAVINFSKRLTPGSRNKGYRPKYRQSL